MGHLTITNDGGSLSTEALSWSEDQENSVAKHKVPMRVTGGIINTGIRVLKSRKISTMIRASDDELTTLNAIYNSKTEVTITLTDDNDSNSWTYIGWFEQKPSSYALVSDGATTRKWKCYLVFKIRTFSYGV